MPRLELLSKVEGDSPESGLYAFRRNDIEPPLFAVIGVDGDTVRPRGPYTLEQYQALQEMQDDDVARRAHIADIWAMETPVGYFFDAEDFALTRLHDRGGDYPGGTDGIARATAALVLGITPE